MHESSVRFVLTGRCALCTVAVMEQTIDIKSLRKKIGWRQERLARYLGVDRSSVSRMENGQPLGGPVQRLMLMLQESAEAGSVDHLCPAVASDLEAAE